MSAGNPDQKVYVYAVFSSLINVIGICQDQHVNLQLLHLVSLTCHSATDACAEALGLWPRLEFQFWRFWFFISLGGIIRGPQMGGQIRRGRIWRFWGAPISVQTSPDTCF